MSLRNAPTFKQPTDCPEWLKPFFQGQYKYLNSGGFKHVFSNGECAISVEKYILNFEKDRNEVYDVLRTIPKEFSDHFVIPTKTYYVQFRVKPERRRMASFQPLSGETKYAEEEDIYVLFSLMNLCPKGDILTTLERKNNNKYPITEKHIGDLANALKYVHSRGIYIGDLKAENIALCTCDCLAFLDLDMASIPSSFEGNFLVRRTTGDKWWNPITQWLIRQKAVPKEICAFNDWFAFAILYMLHSAKNGDMIPDWADELDAQYSEEYGSVGDLRVKQLKNKRLKEAIGLYNKANLYFNLNMEYEFGVYKEFVATF